MIDTLSVGGKAAAATGGSAAFWEQVREVGSCWIWEGSQRRRYGRFRDLAAHRYAYEHIRSEIPPGLELDHLCETPLCVNPWHLEPVTSAENIRRRSVNQTHCKHGHPLSGDNLYVWRGKMRVCRTCNRARVAEYAARKAGGR